MGGFFGLLLPGTLIPLGIFLLVVAIVASVHLWQRFQAEDQEASEREMLERESMAMSEKLSFALAAQTEASERSSPPHDREKFVSFSERSSTTPFLFCTTEDHELPVVKVKREHVEEDVVTTPAPQPRAPQPALQQTQQPRATPALPPVPDAPPPPEEQPPRHPLENEGELANADTSAANQSQAGHLPPETPEEVEWTEVRRLKKRAKHKAKKQKERTDRESRILAMLSELESDNRELRERNDVAEREYLALQQRQLEDAALSRGKNVLGRVSHRAEGRGTAAPKNPLPDFFGYNTEPPAPTPPRVALPTRHTPLSVASASDTPQETPEAAQWKESMRMVGLTNEPETTRTLTDMNTSHLSGGGGPLQSLPLSEGPPGFQGLRSPPRRGPMFFPLPQQPPSGPSEQGQSPPRPPPPHHPVHPAPMPMQTPQHRAPPLNITDPRAASAATAQQRSFDPLLDASAASQPYGHRPMTTGPPVREGWAPPQAPPPRQPPLAPVTWNSWAAGAGAGTVEY